MVNQQKSKDSFSFSFSHLGVMCLNSGALMKWRHKIKYPFKLNLAAFINNSLHSNLADEQTSSQDAETLTSSTSVVVRLYSSTLYSSFNKKSCRRKHTQDGHIHNLISLFGLTYTFIQAWLSQPPSKRTSIFLTRASVSYHIWMDPGSWRVRVIRSTMQYEAVVKIRRRMMPLLSACGTMADTMTKMAEKK